jgi:hypothetical protein
MQQKRNYFMKFEWEEIYFLQTGQFLNAGQATFRAKVPGGWLIRHDNYMDSEREKGLDGLTLMQSCMVFVPCPNHKWEISE